MKSGVFQVVLTEDLSSTVHKSTTLLGYEEIRYLTISMTAYLLILFTDFYALVNPSAFVSKVVCIGPK